ncbi:CDP-alcohol phosphatidyltransferase family protein [Calorimonas adulescens]|uniref:CDP-diacylglycerol--glycerol-3-phosphate 3-phosphatidyltransferase n=1 Tax=Calorimonas adulescens TaxID=2606906 RepID=A0A5D8QAE3_9THEO|nr:CDP-alcohol phosphatidyltransferase family protein [Calorimonas adulescens]TZE81725.1 CDP-diacylglycerol--glycerol-3-phosphate 3-phosphatidyltransferase [Calorimonas adulescens]
MNIPNLLSTMRLILSPTIIWLFLRDQTLMGYIIFGLAALTDILDGFIARKYNVRTKLGTVLDPLADKVLALSVLFTLAMKEIIPYWIPGILAVKEMIMVAGGLFLWNKGVVIPANIFGKVATASTYAAVLGSYVDRTIGLYGLILTVALSIVALFSYGRIFFKEKV